MRPLEASNPPAYQPLRRVTLRQPAKLVFGCGCLADCANDLAAANYRNILVVTSPPVATLADPLVSALRARSASVLVLDDIAAEPTVEVFERLAERARSARPDAVVGLGGGSALDAAKLVAALWDSAEKVMDVFGIGLLKGRRTHLACVPTTSGTGSEVSPGAILLDPGDNLKKGIISPWLVPDASYIDPQLTISMPPGVTASTGLDALHIASKRIQTGLPTRPWTSTRSKASGGSEFPWYGRCVAATISKRGSLWRWRARSADSALVR